MAKIKITLLSLIFFLVLGIANASHSSSEYFNLSIGFSSDVDLVSKLDVFVNKNFSVGGNYGTYVDYEHQKGHSMGGNVKIWFDPLSCSSKSGNSIRYDTYTEVFLEKWDLTYRSTLGRESDTKSDFWAFGLLFGEIIYIKNFFTGMEFGARVNTKTNSIRDSDSILLQTFRFNIIFGFGI